MIERNEVGSECDKSAATKKGDCLVRALLESPRSNPQFFGVALLAFLEMVGSRPDRPLRTPGLLLRPAISLGDLQQL